MPAATDVQSFPAGFRTEDIQTNGTTLHVRVGGQGPAVILLHGYGETGDMWAPLAVDLAQDHTRGHHTICTKLHAKLPAA
jgi:pimeloyl-ACP methyl ester carboxylesterase